MDEKGNQIDHTLFYPEHTHDWRWKNRVVNLEVFGKK